MSKMALKLIAENKKTHATFLDLGNCNLKVIPKELSELIWLEKLSFAKQWFDFDKEDRKNHITINNGSPNQFPTLCAYILSTSQVNSIFKTTNENPFDQLIKLKTLRINGNYNKKIEFSNLTPLSGLAKLQQLDLSHTLVTDLTPLAGLAELQQLDVSNTLITELTPLTGLAELQLLDVSNTLISDLTPLAGLTELQLLDVSNTLISDLTPLAGLAELQRLNIVETQVNDISPILKLIKTDIEVKWGSNAGKGNGIYLKNCPLTNPPAEVVKQGNAAILNYFREKETQGVDHLYEAKMLIIGESGAGKTSLLRRLYQPKLPLPEEDESTQGIDIVQHEFAINKDRNFRLNVWDFGGQEIYHATHQFFLTKRSLYVLLDDTRNNYKSVHDDGFKYWLEVVELLGDHSPVLIFQNEKRGRSKTIDKSGIKGKFDNVKEFYRGDLQQPHAADDLRRAIELFAQQLPHIGEELPAKWVTIRAEIETLAEQQAYISQQAYFDIYGKHLKYDRTKALFLSEYLHDLGAFLHFQDDPLLARTVILQNNWATAAVFKILDDETIKSNWGHFSADDCNRLWQDSNYTDMHLELLALMQKFELCYRLPDQKPETWLAPQLLSPSRPVTMQDWASLDDLVLRYRYEFLPKGMISRLIVRMHRFVKNPELSWSTGVLFERNDTSLLVDIPEQGGEIVLRARGLERKELLSVISSDLDSLNASFHSLPEMIIILVPCICNRCIKLAEPEFFEQKRLLQRKKDGKLQIECPR